MLVHVGMHRGIANFAVEDVLLNHLHEVRVSDPAKEFHSDENALIFLLVRKPWDVFFCFFVVLKGKNNGSRHSAQPLQQALDRSIVLLLLHHFFLQQYDRDGPLFRHPAALQLVRVFLQQSVIHALLCDLHDVHVAIVSPVPLSREHTLGIDAVVIVRCNGRGVVLFGILGEHFGDRLFCARVDGILLTRLLLWVHIVYILKRLPAPILFVRAVTVLLVLFPFRLPFTFFRVVAVHLVPVTAVRTVIVRLDPVTAARTVTVRLALCLDSAHLFFDRVTHVPHDLLMALLRINNSSILRVLIDV
mmetsp:Transcript_50430/g.128423  ORF Transcript_50430/g.128423 Transcript_50430/m.128423 type:complete len:303 (+) Transcript_50430:1592-2500(+)